MIPGSPFCHAWWTPVDSPTVRAATAALVEAGIDPTPTHYSFCTNGSLTAGLLGIPTLGFGVGLEHIAHQVDHLRFSIDPQAGNAIVNARRGPRRVEGRSLDLVFRRGLSKIVIHALIDERIVARHRFHQRLIGHFP